MSAGQARPHSLVRRGRRGAGRAGRASQKGTVFGRLCPEMGPVQSPEAGAKRYISAATDRRARERGILSRTAAVSCDKWYSSPSICAPLSQSPRLSGRQIPLLMAALMSERATATPKRTSARLPNKIRLGIWTPIDDRRIAGPFEALAAPALASLESTQETCHPLRVRFWDIWFGCVIRPPLAGVAIRLDIASGQRSREVFVAETNSRAAALAGPSLAPFLAR